MARRVRSNSRVGAWSFARVIELSLFDTPKHMFGDGAHAPATMDHEGANLPLFTFVMSYKGATQVRVVGAVAALVAVAGLTGVVAMASERPGELACLSGSVPPLFAPLNAPPLAQATRVPTGAVPPVGASCFGKSDSAVWITVASLVRTSDSQATFIERFGSISALLTVRYWSTTDQQWRPMVSSASAIVSASSRLPRADYSLAELLTGEDRYYSMTDTRSGRAVAYRLRLWQNQPTEFVVEITNVDPIKQWGITLYGPGGLHTLYLLKKQSPDSWAYYSITRVLPNSFLAEGHDKSYINRAVALYRYVVGLQTDTEPPSAR
jgi:hypothetical protein